MIGIIDNLMSIAQTFFQNRLPLQQPRQFLFRAFVSCIDRTHNGSILREKRILSTIPYMSLKWLIKANKIMVY